MKGFRYYRNCTLSILMAISGLALFVFLLSQPLYGLPDKSELKKSQVKLVGSKYITDRVFDLSLIAATQHLNTHQQRAR